MRTHQAPDGITWRLHLRSSPDVVYDALDSDAGRASFWAETAIEHDGSVLFRFINGERYDGQILERVRPLRWTVDYYGAPVTFTLTDDGRGGTDVVMTHPVDDEGARQQMTPGWLNVLLPMKAAIDHGIDLHNHDPARTWDQRYVDH